MSELRTVFAVGALATTLAGAVPALATAQSRSVNIDSLRTEVRRLDSLASEQGRVVDSLRKSLVRSVPPVTVRNGSLEVRTVSALESRVRVAVDSVSALIDREGGPELASRVATRTPVIRPDSTRAVLGMLRVISLSPDTTRQSTPRARRPVMASAGAGQIANELTGLIEQFAAQHVDSSFAAWLMAGRVPLRPASADELGDAYTELATTQSAAIRRCRSGENAACLDVLGIDSLPGSRLARWYSPADYRALLRTVIPPREDSAGVAAWVRCRDRHDDDACVRAATALPNRRIPVPLTGTARAILLREALHAGGPGAYGRLVGTSGPMRARLEHAAGRSADVIVARWRDRIEDARPDRMSVGPGLVLASLGWSGALLGLTLIRRRPWA
jgi:hypothetical protein